MGELTSTKVALTQKKSPDENGKTGPYKSGPNTEKSLVENGRTGLHKSGWEWEK